VKRSRSPLAWRLIIWLILLAFLPLAIVYFFMQQQVREIYLDDQLEILAGQVRLYSTRLQLTPGEEQSTTRALANITDNSVFFLISGNGKYIAHSDSAKIGTFASDDLGFSLTKLLLSRESYEMVDSEKKVMIASYRKNITDPLAVTIVSLDRLQNPVENLTTNLLNRLTIGLLIMAVAGGAFLLIQMLPSYQLAEFTKQLGKKNFLATLDISKFSGEHKIVAQSLMDLSADIQGMVNELEQNVIDRTHELEIRATQLKAAADVGKAATSVRNLSELLQQTTNLVNERFKFYHVGIFLLDDRKEYAVLSASNSEGGKRMLEKNHKLKVDEKSIVGFVAQNVNARIALDVGQDAVYFDNPDLPNTRSEMALPLVASGQVLGVLDVQSTEPSAFSEEDVATLQIVADQIAIAIQNANLFTETEKALQASRDVYGDVSREAWKKVINNEPRIGYIATPSGVSPTHSETLETNMSKSFETGKVLTANDGLTITVPIKIRGQVIGGIRLKKSDISDAWTQDETNLAVTLSDQLSGALESARLYRESQQRAVRETLVSDISARISSVSRIDAILRETVQELGQTFGNTTVSFQMVNPSNGQDQGQDPDEIERKEMI
jgi:GAF domain-containing protein